MGGCGCQRLQTNSIDFGFKKVWMMGWDERTINELHMVIEIKSGENDRQKRDEH